LKKVLSPLIVSFWRWLGKNPKEKHKIKVTPTFLCESWCKNAEILGVGVATVNEFFMVINFSRQPN